MVNSAADSDSPRSPYLLVRVGEQSTQKLVLEAELGIGRAEDNGLRLSDPKVSRYHARVIKREDAFTLTDLGSANGTLVNGVRLTAPHSLQHGELITIGDAELTFQEPAAASADTLTSPVVVPPPTFPPSAQAKGGKRGLVIGAILVVAALLILLCGLVVFRLLPGL